MHPIKYVWALRALLYKPFMKKVGFMTYIGKPCFIGGMGRISIGGKVRIFPNVRMEAIGTGEIEIGDNTAIQQNVHITSSGGVLHIGKDVTILANAFVTNMDHRYDDLSKSILEQGVTGQETSIGDGCMIGASAAVMAGTILGKHCVVGTGAVVRGVFPDYCVIMGNPARIIKKYDAKEKCWE